MKQKVRFFHFYDFFLIFIKIYDFADQHWLNLFGLGILVPVRLPEESEDLLPEDFTFCINCKGMYKAGRVFRVHVLDHCEYRNSDRRLNKEAVTKSIKLTSTMWNESDESDTESN